MWVRRGGVFVIGLVIWAGCGNGSNSSGSGAEGSGGGSSSTDSGGNNSVTTDDSTSSGGTGGESDPGMDAAGAGAEGGEPTECECDDGIACTLDSCNSGECEHLARHFECPTSQYCSDILGCSLGDACATDDDCVSPDNCASAGCDPSSRRCTFVFLDGDHDGVAPEICGGVDCNDDDANTYGGAAELCDGRDNDCDGEIDPPDDSGCDAGKSCIYGVCACDAPNSECSEICVNLDEDPENCGSCGNACSDNEACADGECGCNEGLSVCGASCVDLTTDPRNCGRCSNSCGNGICQDSACACSPGETDCSSGGTWICTPTATDPYNCGDCGTSCLHGGACAGGVCDTSLEWLRVFGANTGEREYILETAIDSDAAGNLYVVFSAESGQYTEYPDEEGTLWTSANVIAKFDGAGDLLWAQPSTGRLNDVAVVDDEVWVVTTAAAALTPNVNIAGQAMSVASGYDYMTAVVTLSASDGTPVDAFQLDHTEFGSEPLPVLLHDDQNVWVIGTFPDIRRDGTTWTRPSMSYGGFIYPVGGVPHWLPGRVYRAVLDASGRIVVLVDLPASGTVTFGGDSFDASDGWGIARYSTSLSYDTSFVRSFGLPAGGIDSFTLIDSGSGDFLQQLDDAGTLLESAGGTEVPFRPIQVQANQGRIFMIGSASSSTDYEGRKFPNGFYAGLMSFDEDSLDLEQAVVFDVEKFTSYGLGEVADFVFADDGASVILAAEWEAGIEVGDQLIEPGRNRRGFALVKVSVVGP